MPPRNHGDRFAARVLAHYRKHRRDLPWRQTDDAYAVWVSEIMLQQTRVAAVIPYYERWLERFPTVSALADADADDVLASWAGLGYYSRARNLHRGAREVVERYGGRLPEEVAELRSIPGIGRYTAGAIASIAHGVSAPLLDGNVARVFARYFAIDGEITSSKVQKALWTLAEELVPAQDAGDYNQGLMELGATICTPTSPGCTGCPLRGGCEARKLGRVDELPRRKARKKKHEKPLLATAALWCLKRGRLLVARRHRSGLFGGLWELPQASTRAELKQQFSSELEELERRAAHVHTQELSHRLLKISVYRAQLRKKPPTLAETPYDRLAWYSLPALADLGVSAATRSITASLQESQPCQTRSRP